MRGGEREKKERGEGCALGVELHACAGGSEVGAREWSACACEVGEPGANAVWGGGQAGLLPR